MISSVRFISSPLQQGGVRDRPPPTFWSGVKHFPASGEAQPHNSSDGGGTEPGSLTGQTNSQAVELLLKKGLGISPPLPPCPLLPLAMA